MSTKTDKFGDYLKKKIAGKGKEHTHTRIGGQDQGKNVHGGIYKIEDSEYEDFMKKYYKHVFTDGNKEYLTEKQLIDNGPVLVDIDLHYDTSIKTRKYNNEDKYDLIERYLKIIKEVCEIDNDINVEIFILEKQNVNILEDKTKDGIHIIIGLNVCTEIKILLREYFLAQ